MYEYPKEYLSVSQLTQKLQDAGMVIDSQEDAINALTRIISI